jgi:hypothetical protein
MPRFACLNKTNWRGKASAKQFFASESLSLQHWFLGSTKVAFWSAPKCLLEKILLKCEYGRRGLYKQISEQKNQRRVTFKEYKGIPTSSCVIFLALTPRSIRPTACHCTPWQTTAKSSIERCYERAHQSSHTTTSNQSPQHRSDGRESQKQNVERGGRGSKKNYQRKEEQKQTRAKIGKIILRVRL